MRSAPRIRHVPSDSVNIIISKACGCVCLAPCIRGAGVVQVEEDSVFDYIFFISFTLYPAHSRIGRESLVLRHSVPRYRFIDFFCLFIILVMILFFNVAKDKEKGTRGEVFIEK